MPNKNKIMVNNKKIQKYIQLEELSTYLNNGWITGMLQINKNKISNSLIGKKIGKCIDPQKEIERKQKISKSMKGNKNWMYNKRHGNSKQGWYNNIYFDSSWELAFYLYYKEHNMYIERNTTVYDYIFNNEVHKYIPDFITTEGIIEVKGRKDKKAIAKEEQYPEIIIYDHIKMKNILDYIIQKYGNNFYKYFFTKK